MIFVAKIYPIKKSILMTYKSSGCTGTYTKHFKHYLIFLMLQEE